MGGKSHKETGFECPLCEVFTQLAEEAACKALKRVKKDLDIEACKQILHMKLQGASTEEIAKKLGIPVDALLFAVDYGVKSAQSAIEALQKK
ncbi:MAG: hypothetical protein JRD89_20450 [Deltaproteobacteria bacterium]|nr:hypothetical protein [Deltaproteobacteria bacterium]